MRGDTGVADIREVERGVYVSVDVGPNHFLYSKQPGSVTIGRELFSDPSRPTSWFSPGTRMGLRFGFDVLNNVNAELFAVGNFNGGELAASELAAGGLSGDVTNLAVGGGGRFAFLTTERIFAFVRAGLGYGFWFPAKLADDALGSLYVDGSLGVEYYTKLRHLSVGCELAVQALLFPNAFGVALYPTVKYTF